MAAAAVITADIVNSTQLEKQAEKKLLRALSVLLSPYRFEFYRGDSFQAYLPDAAAAYETVLLARLAAKKLLPAASAPPADIRASIGIGKVNGPVRNLRTATGEAFVLSGRTFDAMRQHGRRLAITSPGPAVNLGLKVLAGYTDFVFEELTAKQAAVMAELLAGHTQQEAARRLKKSQATVNKHAKAAGWPAISTLLEDYKRFIELL